jgi:hypothetical protein
MRNQKPNLFLLIGILFIYCLTACNKVDKQIEDNLNSKYNNSVKSSSERKIKSGMDSLDYYLNMDNPMRDVVRYVKNGGRLPETKRFPGFKSYFRERTLTNEILNNNQFPHFCVTNSYTSGIIVVFSYPGMPDPCNNGGETDRKTISTNSTLNAECFSYLLDAWGKKYML